jgi:hypothetical protein
MTAGQCGRNYVIKLKIKDCVPADAVGRSLSDPDLTLSGEYFPQKTLFEPRPGMNCSSSRTKVPLELFKIIFLFRRSNDFAACTRGLSVGPGESLSLAARQRLT